MNTYSTRYCRYLPLPRGHRPMPPQRVWQSPTLHVMLQDASGAWQWENIYNLPVARPPDGDFISWRARVGVAWAGEPTAVVLKVIQGGLVAVRERGLIDHFFFEQRRGFELWVWRARR